VKHQVLKRLPVNVNAISRHWRGMTLTSINHGACSSAHANAPQAASPMKA
jgi:hypothetical protein